MSGKYDLVVIGGGPAGYVGSIRAAQLGLKVALVESRLTLGGTCLNVGCIPSKALLQSSHHYEMAAKEFKNHGIEFTGLNLNLKSMLTRKDKAVDDLTKGIEFLIKKNKIDRIAGLGEIIAPGKVSVSQENRGKKEFLQTENIMIATGSKVASLPGIEIDENRIISSTGALNLSEVPKEMAVIGAGVIGLELGTVWRRLGANVTVIEFLDVVLPGMDNEVSKTMQRTLEKQGLNFKMSTKVTAAKTSNSNVTLSLEPCDGRTPEAVKADVVLVAIGRVPFTDKLGLNNLDITLDDRGFILVDEDYQTNVPGIYAVGDVIGGPMLAHKAEEEAVVCSEILAGQTGHIDYDTIPGIVYTHPEVATAGKTEEQLKKSGTDYNVGKFPFSANSRARCNDDADGFVKILSAKSNDRILGCHIIGPQAGDLIQEVVNVMEFCGSAEDIARICHGHPGLPEAVKEAALATGGRAIHI